MYVLAYDIGDVVKITRPGIECEVNSIHITENGIVYILEAWSEDGEPIVYEMSARSLEPVKVKSNEGTSVVKPGTKSTPKSGTKSTDIE